MGRDTTPSTIQDCEVMASIDGGNGQERLIIAELCREDAWISAPMSETLIITDCQ